MATTIGVSTYQQVIDDVRFDLNEGPRLSQLPDRAMQKWILDAEEQISKRIKIPESYRLGLNLDVADYPFQDRPPITGASNATPIVITAVAHGLATGDRIYVTGVLGNTAANGWFYVTYASADTFSIKRVLDVEDASNESPIEITASEHGFTTGDSVTIASVEGNTAANGTFTVTVTGVNTFTLDGSTGNDTYTGGGIATEDSVGNGTYTSGGRFWRDDELPTYLQDLTYGRRLFGNYIRRMDPVAIKTLLGSEQLDSNVQFIYTEWDSPSLMGEYQRNGQRYLKAYPTPLEDKTITVYGYMRVTPRVYQTDPLTGSLHLPFKYEDTIRHYVAYKTCQWLKDEASIKRAMEYFTMFEKALDEHGRMENKHARIEVTYQ